MKKKVIFLGVGGTVGGVASSADDNVGYVAAQVGIESLLDGMPGLHEALQGHEVGFEQVAQLDSKDLDFSDCATLSMRIAHYLSMHDVCAVIVTHGTDTLEESAFFLNETIPTRLSSTKPIVLTCAMRPASSLFPDGPHNILDAVSVATTPCAVGVIVVCAGVAYLGEGIQKVHPYRLDAFDAGESAPIGFIEERNLRRVGPWPSPSANADRNAEAIRSVAIWPRVEILTSYIGANRASVSALLACPPDVPPVKGIVVASTGNGTLHYALEEGLRQALVAGVRVIRTSRCRQGRIVTGQAANETFPVALNAHPLKARISLILELLSTNS
jgi:L-asparaginase